MDIVQIIPATTGYTAAFFDRSVRSLDAGAVSAAIVLKPIVAWALIRAPAGGSEVEALVLGDSGNLVVAWSDPAMLGTLAPYEEKDKFTARVRALIEDEVFYEQTLEEQYDPNNRENE